MSTTFCTTGLSPRANLSLALRFTPPSASCSDPSRSLFTQLAQPPATILTLLLIPRHLHLPRRQQIPSTIRRRVGLSARPVVTATTSPEAPRTAHGTPP